jgi:hypothetical protein
MQLDQSTHRARQNTLVHGALWFIAGALLFVALMQSLTVTVAWWRNELPDTQPADWFWILLLPLLIGIYLRFFSVFRIDCHACLPQDRSTPNEPRAP